VVGVDVSLRPWAWAVAVNGRWVSGELPDGRDPAGSLREALEAARVPDRAVALAIPMHSVAWDTIPGLRLRSRQARKAAALAAATRLRVTPREAVVSLDEARGGVMYACAERAVIGSLMAPWLAAGFAVPVVEPAAVSLLRGVGSDRPVVIVRVGDGEVEIVAGSRDRLLFARSVPVAWAPGQANAVRLEVDATIDAARKEGEAVERVLVGGRGDLGALLAAFGDGAGQVALSADYRMPEITPWAVAAASAALWKTVSPRRSHRGGAARGLAWLSTIAHTAGHGRRAGAEDPHEA
jgi:hypothetical protein